jgi:hypothetical protein
MIDDLAEGRASRRKTAVAHSARQRAEQQKRRAFNAEDKHLRMVSRAGSEGYALCGRWTVWRVGRGRVRDESQPEVERVERRGGLGPG